MVYFNMLLIKLKVIGALGNPNFFLSLEELPFLNQYFQCFQVTEEFLLAEKKVGQGKKILMLSKI